MARARSGLGFALFLVAAACSAPEAVNREPVVIDDEDAGSGGGGGRGGSGGGRGGSGGGGGTGGGGGGSGGQADAGADRPPADAGGGTGADASADTASSPDTAPDMAMTSPDAAPPATKVLFVVGNPAMLGAGDTKLKAQLEAKGFTVKMGDDAGPASDANGQEIILISHSVASMMVTDRFLNSPLAVVCMEGFVFDDMKLTGPTEATDYDTDFGNQIVITMANHPLAAGLTGTITVAPTGGMPDINWGVPGPGAVKVASWPGMANRTTIFAYPAGAMMVGATAAGKRVGLFITERVSAEISADALKLFDAAMAWAAAR